MIQFGVIMLVLAAAIILTLRFITARMWKPFEETLRRLESFRLENEVLPTLPDSDVAEFARLNKTLHSLMQNSINSYKTQKEFTENGPLTNCRLLLRFSKVSLISYCSNRN